MSRSDDAEKLRPIETLGVCTARSLELAVLF